MLQRTANPRTDFLYRKGPYLYFRFPPRFKVKMVGLPANETSKAFERQYDACLATLRKIEADAGIKSDPQPVPLKKKKSEYGTIAKAIEIYLGTTKKPG